ncbi:oligosaccharide flippase family protein [Magnetospirillum sp. 15-1]|uniref:oligosaccharide flippase family protein n=1 Tax=Magnetospirillum sp. 15-1 TaxID=1979370 RepID=UPI00148351EA|nr:oligosaccharide flippase family protein [Magnetospirillum sp. 15-1]
MLIKLARAGGRALAGGNAAQAAAGFAANLLLVRFVVPEDFGRFPVILATVNLALVMASLRTNILIIRYPEAGLDSRRLAVYHSISVIETILVTLGAALWLALAEDAGPLELSLLAAIGLAHWLNLNKAFFERSMAYGRIAICETATSLTGHAVSVVAVLTGLGALSLYLREIVAALVQAAALGRASALTLHPLVWPSAAEWRGVLAEARGAWADGVLEGALARVVILCTAALGGERAAGLLAQAQRLAGVRHQVLAPMVTRVAGTWFGQTTDAGEKTAGRRRLLVMVALPLAIAAAGAVLFADPVVPWLFCENWRAAAPLLAALGGFILFNTLFEIGRSYALAGGLTLPLMAGRLCQYGGLGLGLALAADPAMGAALGLSVAAIAAFTLTEALLRRREER